MELVAGRTEDGLELHGVLVPPTDRSFATLVHVHGKCGNFYQNYFIRVFAEECARRGLGFLAMNTRGRDCLADMLVGESVMYLGGSLERFEDCLLDIDLMYGMAAQNSDSVILQGHSFGCEKVLHYASQRDPRVPLVLLSPSSSRDVQVSYSGQSVEEQLKALESLPPRLEGEPEWVDMLPSRSYGVNESDAKYPIPVTRHALVDLLHSNAMNLLDFVGDWRPRQQIDRGFVYLGGRDPYITRAPHVVKKHLGHLFRDVSVMEVPEGDHHFTGCEKKVVGAVLAWALQQTQANHIDSEREG
ncbi:alpha/beta hydrolase [Streptomyces griseoincarnatus]